MCLFGVPVQAAQESAEEAPTRWQMIQEVEHKKQQLFIEYQEEKQRLREEYQATLQKLTTDQPEDYNRQKIKLEKSYKSKTTKLLNQFRQYNLALKKRESALKGRRYVPHRELSTLYRIKKGAKLDPVIGTRPPTAVNNKGYVTDTRPASTSYTDRTKTGIGYLRGKPVRR